jgi:transposase
MKPANKAEGASAALAVEETTAAEPVERRAWTEGNADQQSTCRTQCRESVSQALERIRRTLVGEVFYREFANRRQLGSYVGLASSPFCSGSLDRDQGISKAGDPKARK